MAGRARQRVAAVKGAGTGRTCCRLAFNQVSARPRAHPSSHPFPDGIAIAWNEPEVVFNDWLNP
jgi:hypothetical protein